MPQSRYYDPKKLKERGIIQKTELIAGWYEGVVYYIPCDTCHTDYVRSRTVDFNKVYICPRCRKRIRSAKAEKDREEKLAEVKKLYDESIDEKHLLRFEKAVDHIEENVSKERFKKYGTSIDILRKNADLFDSIPEAVASIQLLNEGYRIVPQAKVGRYRIDVALPDIKCFVEIDGSIYHKTKESEARRDYAIRSAYHYKWAIVRIPSDFVMNKFTELRTYITADRLRQVRDGSVLSENGSK